MTDTNNDTQTTDATPSRATGPRTEAGKAVSSRSALADPEGATTHGLFCRQTVLPHLGEDPAAYNHLLDTLKDQLRPRNLMETQSVELWADASWKLRRLSRLEAQAWEDDYEGDDALIKRLERLSRLQSGLRRQMDKAVRALCRDLPDLFARRNREDLMAEMHLTETQARHSPVLTDRLDNAPAHENCQNEPAPGTGMACHAPTPTPPELGAGGPPNPPAAGGPCERSEQGGGQICQNEPPPASSPLPEAQPPNDKPLSHSDGGGGLPAPSVSKHTHRDFCWTGA